jgi:DNA-binding response OmpR family regulator/signal transduction histidine kinase
MEQLPLFLAFLFLPLLIAAVWQYRKNFNRAEVSALGRSESDPLVLASVEEDRASSRTAQILNTPITLARVPAEYLMQHFSGQLSTREQALLLAIQRNLDRLAEITQEMQLARPPGQTSFAVFHLPFFVAEMRNCFEPMAKSRDIRFQPVLDIEPDTEVLLTDTLKFDKIVLNLLVNAFHYTPEGGEIRLLLHTRQLADRSVRLSCTVSDTGPALAAADLPHLERWQYRGGVESAVSRAGAGLLLSAEIARALGGALQAANTAEGGAAFTVSVCCAKASLQAPSADREDSALAGALWADSPEGVLHIVEDDSEMLEMLKTGLSPCFHIETYNTAEAFLQAAVKHAGSGRVTFDAVLIDLTLPGMGGLELLRSIREHSLLHTIPVVVLTAGSLAANREQAFQLGADDYILKPFKMQELRIRLRNAMQRYSTRAVGSPENGARRDAMKKLPVEARVSTGKLILDTIPNKKREWFVALLQIIEDNLDDEQLSVPFLARKMAVSERQLFRLIKESTGFSPNQLVQEIRLGKALHLLEDRADLSVSDIAQQIGMSNPSYFAIAFKKRFRKSPSDFRKQYGDWGLGIGDWGLGIED